MNDPTEILTQSPLLAAVREKTPARILAGHSGGAYRTRSHLELLADHAAARDAVAASFDLYRDLGPDIASKYSIFEVTSQARSKEEFLLRPDLGRRLDEEARERVAKDCSAKADLQIVLGDGLSATALAVQAPVLLPLLMEAGEKKGWRVGRTFVVRHCRVGILNDVGEILAPEVVVLLIGERPGLATAESLSAYMAFRPRAEHTDAQRNLISNIHARGVAPVEACARIIALADLMRAQQCSGVAVKEDLTALGSAKQISTGS